MSRITIEYITFAGRKGHRKLSTDSERVDLMERNITDLNLDPLSAQENLRSLYLMNNRLKTVNLSPLASCAYLEQLWLGENELEGIDLSPLASCVELKELQLEGNKLKDVDLSPLQGLVKLQTIWLSNNHLKMLDLSPLSHCTRLRDVFLQDNDLDVADFSPVLENPYLQYLLLDPHVEIRAEPDAWKARMVRDDTAGYPRMREIELKPLRGQSPVGRPRITRTPEQKPLEELLRQGENDKTEFKSSLRWDLREQRVNKELEEELTKAAVGFMNADGGVIVIGADDQGGVVGLAGDYEKAGLKNKDGFERQLRQAIDHQILRAHERLVKVRFQKKEGKELCLVDVGPSPKPVFFVSKDRTRLFFVRLGNSTKALGVDEALDYVQRHWPNKRSQ